LRVSFVQVFAGAAPLINIAALQYLEDAVYCSLSNNDLRLLGIEYCAAVPCECNYDVYLLTLPAPSAVVTAFVSLRAAGIPVLIHCFHCEGTGENDGYTEQRKYFMDAGLLPPDKGTIQRMTRAEREEYAQAKREAAKELWSRLWPIKPNHIAGRYLCARGLESFIGHTSLRCAAHLHPVTGFHYVLAARMFHVNYGLCAVQLTYLKSDGNDRDRSLNPGRKTLGAMKGGAAWIGRPVNGEVVIGEGLETTMSAMLLMGVKCGAAALGPNLKDIVLPSSIAKIRIAADNDETGRNAAAHYRGLHPGCNVKVSIPDKEGWDFNDVLRSVRQ
jgi:hypothetical protein